jgi:uncharacterized membrane protein YccC
LLATALFHVLPVGAGLEVVLVGVMVFVVRGLGPANYGIAATGITALVVFLVALNGIAPNEVMLARGWNTALGGAVALCAYAIWPTWERTQLQETMARMLDAYRAYFHGVRGAYERADAGAQNLDRLRLEGRRARTNLEASADRVGSEPGTRAEQARILGGMLANSHRLAHAMMALEAGLSASRPAPARPEFRVFADHVEATLESLAGALRGRRLEELPDLREDHHALLRSGDGGRYALVNVETDRVVNSLNTLTEDVVGWLQQV